MNLTVKLSFHQIKKKRSTSQRGFAIRAHKREHTTSQINTRN